MRLYWSGREGQKPPPDSRFFLRSFDNYRRESFPFEFVALPDPKSYKPLKQTFSPSFDVWEKNVQKALDLIQKKFIQKVVLGRLCIMEFAEKVDPFAITAALKEKTPGAFVFCFQSKTGSFLGASPERLFCRNEDELLSEAVAGTRPRGIDPTQDKALQAELLQNPKELHEFSLVRNYLKDVLSPLCTVPLNFTPTSIHQTPNVQHLYSQCVGRLKPSVDDEQILSILHPTPSLCGLSKAKAYALIRELEPFDRGLFGGVVGWQTPKYSEGVVAIRSCEIKDNTVTLFSGTGIVEGSHPKEEWEELDQKLKLYDRILVD